MAKRRRTTKKRRYTRRAKKSDLAGNLIDGVLVGVVNGFMPEGILRTASPLMVGYFRNNGTLQTLGAVQLGMSLSGIVTGALGGLFGSNGTSNGTFLGGS